MFPFKITPDDPQAEPFDIVAGMRDLRVWEKTNPKRSMGSLNTPSAISATVMFEVAYAACVRQQRIPRGMTLDEFAETHEIEMPDEDDEEAQTAVEQVGPTEPVA